MLELPLDRFYNSPRNADGLMTQCKTCSSEANRQWRARNADRAREYAKEYRNQHINEYRERGREHARRLRSTDGWKERANEKARKERANLSGHYIRSCLVNGSSIARADIPPTLIEKKREQLLMQRAARALKAAIPKPEKLPRQPKPKKLATDRKAHTLPDGSRCCNVCKVVLPLVFFVKDSKRPHGRGYRCVECNRALEREYRERKKNESSKNTR